MDYEREPMVKMGGGGTRWTLLELLIRKASKEKGFAGEGEGRSEKRREELRRQRGCTHTTHRPSVIGNSERKHRTNDGKIGKRRGHRSDKRGNVRVDKKARGYPEKV